jgi:hypothetical protein
LGLVVVAITHPFFDRAANHDGAARGVEIFLRGGANLFGRDLDEAAEHRIHQVRIAVKKREAGQSSASSRSAE